MSLQRFQSTARRVRIQLQSIDDIDKLFICHVQPPAPTSAPQSQGDHQEDHNARAQAGNKENTTPAVRLRKNPKPFRSPSQSDGVDDAVIFKLPSYPPSSTAFNCSRNWPLPTPPRSCGPDSVFLDIPIPEPMHLSEPMNTLEPAQASEPMQIQAPQFIREMPTPPESPSASSFTDLESSPSRGSVIQYPQLLREFQIQREKRWSESASPSPVSTPNRRQGQSSRSPELQRRSKRVIQRDGQVRKRRLSSSSSSSIEHESDISSSSRVVSAYRPRRHRTLSSIEPRMFKLSESIENHDAIEEAAFWSPRRRTRNDFRSSGMNISEDVHVSKVWSLSSAEDQTLARQAKTVIGNARSTTNPPGVVVGTQVTPDDLALSIQKCKEAESKPRETLEILAENVSPSPKTPAKKPSASVPAAQSASSFNTKVCESCGSRETPCWRPGWQANIILCNSCGLRYKKSPIVCPSTTCRYIPQKAEYRDMQKQRVKRCKVCGTIFAPLESKKRR